MRPLSTLLLATLCTACQCLVPVEEGGDPDAGLGACTQAADCPGTAPACDDPTGLLCRCGLNRRCAAGRCETFEHFCPGPLDGGGPADAGGECTTPADCAGDAGPAIRFCGLSGGQWTCAFNRCVVECDGRRTCDSRDAGCLTCDGATVCVGATECPLLTHLHIEESTCPQFTAGAFLRTTSLSSQRCTAAVEDGDGGLAGTVTFFDYQALMADLPLAGGRCVGQQLPTGALRYSLSCPGCMLSVRPEIVGP